MNGKKLYRIKNGAMLTGVCNGLAAYFDVDVNLVRVAAVLLVSLTGVGLVAYIAAAVILPEVENSPYPTAGTSRNANSPYTQAPDVPPADNNNNTDANGKDII